MATGALWMVLAKFIDRSLGFLATIILARLLLPEDYGIVAMAASLIAVIELFGTFGFDIPLIQHRDPDRRYYDTAWTFNVIFGAATAVILLLLAVPVANFYEEPRLPAIVAVLAVGSFVQGLENIGVVNFRKEMQFRKEFSFMLSKKISGFLVAVPLAFILHNYWALIAGMLTSRCFGVAVSYFLHPYRPSLSLAARKELFRFSKWLLLNNIIFFGNNRSADFVVGKLAGPQALGLYSVASELASLPTTELVAPINRAVFPGYAKTSSKLEDLRAAYLKVISIILILALPAATGIAATAELIIPVVLGDKWLAAIPLMQILAIYGAVIAIQTNIAAVYLALAKPQVLTMLAIVNLMVLLPSLVLLSARAGATGAAWAYLGTACVVAPLNFFVLFRSLQLRLSAFMQVVWRPLLATLFMVAAVRIWSYQTEAWLGESLQVLRLLSAVLCGAITYVVCVLLLWLLFSRPEGAERYILSSIAERIGFRRWLPSTR
jgi:O-antigen/teichoic acid export membrane protein